MSVPSTASRVRVATAVAGAVLVSLALALASTATADAKTVWLCKPGQKPNPCDTSRTATVLNKDGTTSVEKDPLPRKKPAIDCFYVYPTVSGQTTATATLTVDPEQKAIAIQQASRFSTVCRVFAPLYRQLTLAGISGALKLTPADSARGPADVQAAWEEYLKKDNHGRGVVLVGHSQGAFVLKALASKYIDGKKAQKRLVSALLLGGNVSVKKGKDVGGQFKKIRACRKNGQIGCVVAYSSFDKEPPSNAKFGRISSGIGASSASDLQVLCTNPANLAGGTGIPKPYVSRDKFPGALAAGINVVPDVPTQWATTPKRYTSRCESRDGSDWLQINHNSGDPRPYFQAKIGADWGLHLGDVNLMWGNLVDVVRSQAKAYAKKH
jgi:pimeloyl-ACP methyl ester carboxylesterase